MGSPSASTALSVRLHQGQAAFAAGEEGAHHISEMLPHRLEGRGKAGLDAVGEFLDEPGELIEALLQVGALLGQESLALHHLLVFLLGQRIHRSDQLAAALQALDLFLEDVQLGRRRRLQLVQPGLGITVLQSLQPRCLFVHLVAQAGDADLALGGGVAGAAQLLLQAGLGGRQLAQAGRMQIALLLALAQLRLEATGHALEDCRQLPDARQQRRAGRLQAAIGGQLPSWFPLRPRCRRSRVGAMRSIAWPRDALALADARRGYLQLGNPAGKLLPARRQGLRHLHPERRRTRRRPRPAARSVSSRRRAGFGQLFIDLRGLRLEDARGTLP